MHLAAAFAGTAGFTLCFAFLFEQTDNLNIFPHDKRYLGAGLCMIACGNAYFLTYKLIGWLIRIAGLLPKSDAIRLSPFMERWPEDWYEYCERPEQPHPLDDAR